MNPGDLERFMKFVEKQQNGCWLWIGARSTRYGYGRFVIDGELRVAHKVIYEHLFGTIPEPLVACHKCDNQSCVNPDHIEVKTSGENQRDAYKRNLRRGNGGPRTKVPVTRELIEQMKQMRASGKRLRVIAEKTGLSISSVHREVRWVR